MMVKKLCFRKIASYTVLGISGMLIFLLLIPTGFLSVVIDMLWQGAGRLIDWADCGSNCTLCGGYGKQRETADLTGCGRSCAVRKGE